MEQKYRLLPAQVENLKKQYDESLLKMQALNGVKNEEFADKKAATGREINLGLDASLLGALTVTARDYRDAKEKLGNYEIIKPNNSDVIGLGSTFEIAMNYGDVTEKEIFTLVEVTNFADDPNLISIDSPLGKAVVGAKAGDTISYMVEKRKFTGAVTDVIKEQEKTL